MQGLLWGKGKLEQQFWEFHFAHPEVYLALVEYAFEWRKRRPYAKLGVKMILERVRWELGIRSMDMPRLNNNHAAFYARLLMDREPELDGLFNLRQQQIQSSFGPANVVVVPNAHIS